jgi:hypothetical protein
MRIADSQNSSSKLTLCFRVFVGGLLGCFRMTFRFGEPISLPMRVCGSSFNFFASRILFGPVRMFIIICIRTTCALYSGTCFGVMFPESLISHFIFHCKNTVFYIYCQNTALLHNTHTTTTTTRMVYTTTTTSTQK